MRRATHKVANAPKTSNPRLSQLQKLPRAVRADPAESEVDKAFDVMYIGIRQEFKNNGGLSWDKYLQTREATWAGIMAIFEDFLGKVKAQVAMEERYAAELAEFKKRPDIAKLSKDNRFLLAEETNVNRQDLLGFKQALKRCEAAIRDIKNVSF